MRVNSAMRDAGSFEFHGEVRFEGLAPEPGVTRLEGFYDFDGPRYRLVTEPIDEDASETTAAPGGEQLIPTAEGGEQRLIGDVFYSFPHLFTRGAEPLVQPYWLEQPADVPVTNSGLPLVDQLRSLLMIPKGFEVESKTSDGDETTFEGVIEYGADPPKSVTALDLKGRISVTTNEDDRLVHVKWLVDQQGPDGRINMTIELSFEDFGAQQNVRRPPPKRTVTLEEYEAFMNGDFVAPVEP